MTVNCIHTGPLYFHLIPKPNKNVVLPIGLESDKKLIQTHLILDHPYNVLNQENSSATLQGKPWSM